VLSIKYKRILADLSLVLGLVLVFVGINIYLHDAGEKGYIDVHSPGLNRSNYEIKLEYQKIYQLEEIRIRIPEGASALKVAEILNEAGLIKKEDFLNLIALFQFQTKIRSGEYVFSSDAGIANILSKILIN
jgi:hypothetical protein